MQQSHSTAERERHHRAPRVWPVLQTEPIVVPLVKPEGSPQLTTLFVTAASVLGIGLAAVFMNASGGAAGGLGVGLLLVSGATAVVSGAAAFFQWVSARGRNGELLRLYTAELDRLEGARGVEGAMAQALRMEAEARRANDLPLVIDDARFVAGYTLPADSAPTRIQGIQHASGTLWQRRPSDPDFLTVRVGVGYARPRTPVELSEKAPIVRLPDRHRGFAQQQQRAIKMVESAQALHGVPIVMPLREHGSVAITAHPSQYDAANAAVRALLAQVALLHSPYDAQITIITSEQRMAEWNWARALSADVDREWPTVIAFGSADGAAQIERLHAALTQREQRLIERSVSHNKGEAQLPHMVIMVDTLAPLPLDHQRTADLLTVAPVALALRRGAEIGVTVITTHYGIDEAPAQCTLALDMEKQEARVMRPDEPEIIPCANMDRLSPQETAPVAHILSRYQPQRDGERELPAEVDLLTLFGPARLDPQAYDINAMWARGRAKLEAQKPPAFAIPIGRTTAPEPLMIDFIKDGPHGMLIGKTGSGKSVLLQSIIAALAMAYPPDKLNFVLVDYKGGLGLEAYAGLPHTLAFLTNLQQAGQTERFLNMLESELRSRQELQRAKKPMPRLFVIIDEFAEMVATHGSSDTSSELIMDQVLSILRLGRGLDVHLLFASQRPESAFAKLRGYVQYRISMRTNSEDDSREIIGRPDAATLPAAFPGRGYLLRGDYQLQTFQAARVDLPLDDAAAASQQTVLDPDAPADNGALIADRIKKHTPASPERWPAALPTPEADMPTPLVLYLHGPLRRVRGAWGSSASAPPRPRDMVAPVGWYDHPKQRAQDWFHVDLLGHQGGMYGGPLLVMGDLNAGKTTTLQTLLLFFATQYSPDELRFFIIDPTGALQEFAATQHARDLREHGHINLIDGINGEEFQAWRARLTQAMRMDPGRRPRVLVVMDDYDEVAQRYYQTAHTSLYDDLTQELIRGRPQNVYLALSASRKDYNTLPDYMLSYMSTKIILNMSKDNMATMLGVGGRLPGALEVAPGRGYVQTRASLAQIQVAAPVYGGNEVERAEGIRALLAQTRWTAR